MAESTYSSLLKGYWTDIEWPHIQPNIYYKILTWLSEMIDIGLFYSKMEPFIFFS